MSPGISDGGGRGKDKPICMGGLRERGKKRVRCNVDLINKDDEAQAGV